MKVLVVEDSPPVRDRILRLLEEEPRLEVVGSAATNVEAWKLFQALHPDLVTLDVSLADGLSLGTLERMVASDRPPAVIVLTGHVEPHYRQRYMEAGATHFLSKLELERLPELIATLLED